MLDSVSFASWWRFRKAGDPVPPISSVSDVPTVANVQEAGVWGSRNSQGGDVGDSNSGNKTRKAQSEGEFLRDKVEDEYPDSEANRSNADDDQDPDGHDFFVPDDIEVFILRIRGFQGFLPFMFLFVIFYGLSWLIKGIA